VIYRNTRTSLTAADCSTIEFHLCYGVYCIDASLNAEAVYKCTDVAESAAQPAGVCFGLRHSVSHFHIDRLPGLCPLTADSWSVHVHLSFCIFGCWVLYAVCSGCIL